MRPERILIKGKIKGYIIRDKKGKEITIISEFLKMNFLNSPNTAKSYASSISIFINFANSMGKEYYEMTKRDLYKFRDHLLTKENEHGIRKWKNSTVKQIFAAIVSLYDHIARHDDTVVFRLLENNWNIEELYKVSYLELLARSPSEKIKIEKRLYTKSSVGCMKESVFRQLLASVETWRDKTILLLARLGGPRAGEILGLRIDDIDFIKKTVNIIFREDNPNGARAKNHSNREIRIDEPEFWLALHNYILEERCIYNPYNSRMLFLSMHGDTLGEAFTYPGLSSVLNYHIKKLGLEDEPNTSIHCLRHTHLTEQAEVLSIEGLLYLMKRAGHSSIRSTLRYFHPSWEYLGDLYEKATEVMRERRKSHAA